MEDEAPALRRLERLVSEQPSLGDAMILTADSVEGAMATLGEAPVDLLLLDLDLSGRDGFTVLRRAGHGGMRTIVVSAGGHRALEAFEHGVLDFVAKPVSEARLSRAIARLWAPDVAPVADTLAVRAQGRVELIPLRDVRRIASADDYVLLHLADGRRVLHDEHLGTLARSLPSHFVRVHRGWIANLQHVVRLRQVDRGTVLLECVDGVKIPVSRRRSAEVSEAVRRVGRLP